MYRTIRLAVFVLALSLFSATAQAEKRYYMGELHLEFPSATSPMEWTIPFAGVGSYLPGTAAATREGFAVNQTLSVMMGTSAPVAGSVANPFSGGGAFDTGQVATFKLQPGFVPVDQSSPYMGFRFSALSLDLSGQTGSGGFANYNHPLVRIGTSFASLHPGGRYFTTSGSTSASASDVTWAATVRSLSAGGGNFNVVAPLVLSTSGGGSLSGQARMQLTFVPEPAAGIMLLGGAFAVYGLGRSRRT